MSLVLGGKGSAPFSSDNGLELSSHGPAQKPSWWQPPLASIPDTRPLCPLPSVITLKLSLVQKWNWGREERKLGRDEMCF